MNCKNISTTTPVLYPNTNNKQQHQKYQVCSHRDSALHRAAILMALTFSLEDSFRKYKIGHRSYSLCLGIRFILCSECLYSDLSALDLLDFRSTLAPTFHSRTQEAWNSTLKIPNSSHSQFQVICLTDMTFFPTKSYAQCRKSLFLYPDHNTYDFLSAYRKKVNSMWFPTYAKNPKTYKVFLFCFVFFCPHFYWSWNPGICQLHKLLKWSKGSSRIPFQTPALPLQNLGLNIRSLSKYLNKISETYHFELMTIKFFGSWLRRSTSPLPLILIPSLITLDTNNHRATVSAFNLWLFTL